MDHIPNVTTTSTTTVTSTKVTPPADQAASLPIIIRTPNFLDFPADIVAHIIYIAPDVFPAILLTHTSFKCLWTFMFNPDIPLERSQVCFF